MRDLALLGFLGALIAFGFRRPFLFALAYVYVDTVSPHRLSYYLLNSIPLSMIVAALALVGWLIADARKGFGVSPRQGLMALLLGYTAWTTFHADFPVEALEKWDWAWKAVAFAIFLPLTLRTKLSIEACVLFLVLSAASIVIVGGIKTVMSGGGYGVLNLMVDNNSGLYESSTASTIAIGIVPLILWLARFGTIFPSDWRVKLFAGALVFACLLMPIGTEARTGLVCIAVLAVLMLRDVKRRFLYLAGAALVATAAIPFLPASFTSRMATIQGYEADQSASTRIAVWQWTWDYAVENPMGGGFGAYRQNRILVPTRDSRMVGDVELVTLRMNPDEGRAYHSAFFEMLGEQGFAGLILFLLIHGIGLARMEIVRRRYRGARDGAEWISPLATALQHFQIIYLVGSVFVGIAYQPFVWLVLGVQIGFDRWVSRRMRIVRRPPMRPDPAIPAPAG
jgi:probable O-glycosylation ligase (exosortase A-associated)